MKRVPLWGTFWSLFKIALNLEQKVSSSELPLHTLPWSIMQQNRCQSCNRTGDNHATERVQVYTVAENTGHIQYKHTLVDTSVIHWPGLHMSTHYKFDMKIWIRINYEKKMWHSLRWSVKMVNQHTLQTKDARKWDKNIFECPASLFVYYSGSGCRYNIISILHIIIISPSDLPPPPPTYLKVKRKGEKQKYQSIFDNNIQKKMELGDTCASEHSVSY